MSDPLSRTELHYRTFLAGRWSRVWRLSLLFSPIPLFISTLQPTLPASISGMFSGIFITSLGALVVFILTVWPLHIFRKIQLSPDHTARSNSTSRAPSTSAGRFLLDVISEGQTWRVVAWYVWTSWVVTMVSATVLSVRSEVDVRLGVFNSTRLYPYHLNERLVYILLSSTLFSTLFALLSILLQTSPVSPLSWPINGPFTTLTRRERLKEEVSNRWRIWAAGVGVWSVGSRLVYGLGRGLGWSWVVRSGGWGAKQLFARFALSRTNPLSLELAIRLALIQIAVILVIEVPGMLFSIFTTQPLDFSPLAAKGNSSADRYLSTALQSKDPFLMNFTITELALVSYSPQRRKSILSDLTTKPTLWGSLWQGIMIQLGTSRKVLLSRGGRVGGGILPRGGSGVLGRPEEMDKNVQAIQVVKTESVFRMAPTQAIQTTKLGAAVQDLAIKEEKLVKVTAGAQSGIQTIFGIITSVLNGVDHTIDWIYKCFRGKDQALDLTSKAKEIFSSAEQLKSTAVTDLITTSKRAQHTAQEKAIELVGEKNMDGVVGNVVATGKVVKGGSRWLRDGYHKMMAKRWAGDEFEMVVPRRRMDEKAIRALTAFIIGSYTEDPYGQVQQNIPSTMEAFAKLHTELATYKAELVQKAKAMDESIGGGEVWMSVLEKSWQEEVLQVVNTIELCIRSIRSTFGDDMQAFVFTAEIAKVLEVAASSPQESS